MALMLNPVTGLLEDDGSTQTAIPTPQPLLKPEAPAPEAPAPTFTPPSLVTTGVTTTSPSSTTSVPVIGAGEKAAESKYNKTLEDGIAATKAQEQLKVERARIEAEAAEKAALAKEEERLKTEERNVALAAAEAADLAEIQEARDAVKNTKITDYWETKGTGQKILAGFAIGLGQLGGGMDGSNQNRALDIINSNINRDLDIQKANLDKTIKEFDMTRQSAGDKRLYRANAEARFGASAAGRIDSIADKYKSKLIAQGIPEAEANTNVVVAGLQASASKQQLAAEVAKRGARTDSSGNVVIKQELSSPSSKSFKETDDLRKEYAGRQETKTTTSLKETYGKLKATQDNAAGDISLIFAYMKMLDPGSVVREGEFATAQNSGGIPTRVINQYNKAKDGTRLTPEQRSDFKNQAGAILAKQVKLQKGVDDEYIRMAKERGYNPKDIIVSGTVEEDTPNTPEVKSVGGKQYRKVPGGWEPIQ